MTDLPNIIQHTIPLAELTNVENWWQKLSPENQKELSAVYNEEIETDNQKVAIQFCGKFVEQEPTESTDTYWINHFYEYIVNHELIVDEYELIGGYTCSVNQAAENAIRTGLLQKDFVCPDGSSSCLMRKLLQLKNGRTSLQFYVKFKLV